LHIKPQNITYTGS